MRPMPATNGAQVRMMGTKRDSTMVIEPYLAKNASVRRRYSTLRKRYLPLKAGGPIHRPMW